MQSDIFFFSTQSFAAVEIVQVAQVVEAVEVVEVVEVVEAVEVVARSDQCWRRSKAF